MGNFKCTMRNFKLRGSTLKAEISYAQPEITDLTTLFYNSNGFMHKHSHCSYQPEYYIISRTGGLH